MQNEMTTKTSKPKTTKPNIDDYDVETFENFLKLAKTEGTDVIKVVCGDKSFEYKVSLHPQTTEQRTRFILGNLCSIKKGTKR